MILNIITALSLLHLSTKESHPRVRNTIINTVLVHNKSSCSSLDHFHRVDIRLVVWRPNGACRCNPNMGRQMLYCLTCAKHLAKFHCKKPLTEFALLVAIFTCCLQLRFLSILTPQIFIMGDS